MNKKEITDNESLEICGGEKDKETPETWSVYTSQSALGKANCFSKLFFFWAFTFVKRAKTEQMSVRDFGGIRPSEHSDRKFKIFERIYKEQQKKSVLGAAVKAFRKELGLVFFLMFMETLLSYMSPFLVHMMIEFVEDPDGETWYGMKLLAILVSS